MLMRLRVAVIAGLLTIFACSPQTRVEEQPVTRAELLAVSLTKPSIAERIVTQRIEMAAGTTGQKHYHPVPVVGYVVAGAIAFQIEGQETQVLHAGDAFYEPADVVVVRWESVGTTRAVFVANYIATEDNNELLVRVD